MVTRTFDFIKCSIYRNTPTIHKWSQIQSKSLIYENIDCSFWGAKSKTSWQLEVNTNTLNYEMNIEADYEIFENDIVLLRGVEYRITDIIPHPNRFNSIDNLQIFLIKNTNG